MAKRSPLDEKPFRPLDASILNGVMQRSLESSRDPMVSQDEFAPSEKEGISPSSSSGPPADSRSSLPQLRRLDQEKRILYTREESQAFDRLVNNLAVRLSCQIKVSHVIRALTGVLLRAEREIDRRAGERGMLVRPPNGDHFGLQAFEFAIADILIQGIRDAGPLIKKEEAWNHDLRRS